MSRNIFYPEGVIDLAVKSGALVQSTVNQYFPSVKPRVVGDGPFKLTLGSLIFTFSSLTAHTIN